MSDSIQPKTQSFHLGPLQHVNTLCQQFEKQRRNNGDADFDLFLEQVSEDNREMLLRNLLQIDLRLRRSAGEKPRAEEYVARLPQYEKVIRREIVASTLKPLQSLRDTAAVAPQKKELASPPVTRLGDYLLEKELGRGAMGVVFAARHLRHGSQVALKTLPTVDGPELHRFKNEFRSLADLNHPNLVGLHTLQADGGQWFFTMDLVDGDDFYRYVRPQNQLDLGRLQEALAQLVTAVNALHARQIVHRDLKPSNVMVSRQGQVRVLDFGLVVDLAATSQEAEIAGTPAYMAPEQFSPLGAAAASDWYAVGVMLYEALSGRLPFSGAMSQIMQAKQTRDPPPLPDDAPEDLVDLCQRLLRRDPYQRPAGDELLRIVRPDAAADLAATSLSHERLVGRDKELHDLEEAIASFEQRQGATAILISGKSGEGKTVLAEHFLERFRADSQTIVLAGRCYDRESVPFKAVDTIIDALCARLKSLPPREVNKLLTPDAAVLAELFPVLHRVQQIANLPRIRLENLELAQVRRLASDALREILRRLSPEAALVCFIDDLQWGDADSAELLLSVLRPPEPPHLLLLGTFRSDEAQTSGFLQVWESAKERLKQEVPQFDCQLTTLSEEQCVQLVIDIVGIDNDAVRQRAREMAQETGGNPFLLSELASCYDPQAETSQPTQMEEVVARKLTLLPADARTLLDVVSVSGHAIALSEAAHTAGHTSVPLSTITRMRTERLLRLVGSEEEMSLDTYHDRIRETVLRDMDTEARQGLHVRLAEEIEASVGGEVGLSEVSQADAGGPEQMNPRVYDLAYHFFEGGDRRAFGYQQQAGEAAIRAYAMENAIEHLKKAEQVMPAQAPPQTRYRLWERLGEACGKTKHVQDALHYYTHAELSASSSMERAVAYSGSGEMRHRMGDLDSALADLDKALLEVGCHRAKWLPSVLWDTSWVLTVCQLMTWCVRPGKSEEARARADLASEVFHRIAQILIIQGDIPRYTHACARTVFTGLRSGSPQRCAVGFAKLGYNYANSSLQTPSKWILNRAIRFAEKSKHPLTKAYVEGHIGMSFYCLGKLQESERVLKKSSEELYRYGEGWLIPLLHHHLRHVYSLYGDSEQALAEAEVEKQFGEALSDADLICYAHYGLADTKARMGLLQEAQEHARQSLRAIEGSQRKSSESIALNHYGFVLLQTSDYSRAVDVLAKAKRVSERHLLYLDYMVHAYPLLLEGLVGPDWLEPRKDAQIRRAKRLVLKTRFFAWRFSNIRPHALRAQGRLLCVRGRRRAAARYFEKSIKSAGKLGLEYDRARSLLDLAAVSEDRRDELRTEAVAILKRLKAVIPYAEKWQLGDDADQACVAPPSQNDDSNSAAPAGAHS